MPSAKKKGSSSGAATGAVALEAKLHTLGIAPVKVVIGGVLTERENQAVSAYASAVTAALRRMQRKGIVVTVREDGRDVRGVPRVTKAGRASIGKAGRSR